MCGETLHEWKLPTANGTHQSTLPFWYPRAPASEEGKKKTQKLPNYCDLLGALNLLCPHCCAGISLGSQQLWSLLCIPEVGKLAHLGQPVPARGTDLVSSHKSRALRFPTLVVESQLIVMQSGSNASADLLHHYLRGVSKPNFGSFIKYLPRKDRHWKHFYWLKKQHVLILATSLEQIEALNLQHLFRAWPSLILEET